MPLHTAGRNTAAALALHAAPQATVPKDSGKKARAQLTSDARKLFQALFDRELVDGVIERLQRFAAEVS